jgi:hypothetical protein
MDYKLYQYESASLEIENLLEDDTLSEEDKESLFITKINNDMQIQERVEQIVKYKYNLDYYEKALSEEIKRLQDKKARVVEKNERLVKNIDDYMRRNNLDILNAGVNRIKYRASKGVVVIDKKRLPADCLKVTVEEVPILPIIKIHIEQGKIDSSVAFIEDRKNIQFKEK